MILVIMRGLPGSGKTTFADDLVKQFREFGLSSCRVSADTYFQTRNGYHFIPSLLPFAHRDCQMDCEAAMRDRVDLIVVDNTNVKREHLEPYIQLAEKHGYSVGEHIVGGTREDQVQEYAIRNRHDVPINVIRRMAKEFEL